MGLLLLPHSLPYLEKEKALLYHKKEIKFNLLKWASKKNGKKKEWKLKMIRVIQGSEVGARRLKRRNKKKKMMKKTVILSLRRKWASVNHEIVVQKQSKKHKLPKRMLWLKQNGLKLAKKLQRKQKNKKRRWLILKMGIGMFPCIMSLRRWILIHPLLM